MGIDGLREQVSAPPILALLLGRTEASRHRGGEHLFGWFPSGECIHGSEYRGVLSLIQDLGQTGLSLRTTVHGGPGYSGGCRRKGFCIMDDLLTVGDASRVLDLTPRYIQDLADKGRLPVMRTARGLRLFRRADVERLAVERTARAERDSRKEGLAAPVEAVAT
jgi:excisionase family DNA binding protein